MRIRMMHDYDYHEDDDHDDADLFICKESFQQDEDS